MSEKRNYDVTTDRLDRILENVGSNIETEQYVKTYTSDGYESFADYYNEYLRKHNLDIPEIIKKSNVSQNYIYNIVNGSRNPGRDKIICLCIGAGMNVREINRGLKIARQGVLYAKDERDARIIIAVNKGNSNVIDLNIILEKEGLEILE